MCISLYFSLIIDTPQLFTTPLCLGVLLCHRVLDPNVRRADLQKGTSRGQLALGELTVIVNRERNSCD